MVRIASTSPSWAGASTPPLLSVVVPVFNTGPYVLNAISSLVPTNTDSLEIIVVHDGGSDNALDIARDWARNTPARVVVLDQPNRGLSSARMVGVEVATGDALAFLDSDDIADVEALLTMAQDINRFQCDVVLGRSAVLDGATLAGSPFFDAALWDQLMRGVAFRRTTVARDPSLLRLEPNANTRVIRRSFFRRVGISFPIGLQYEDPPAHVRGLVHAGAVGLRDEIVYLYRVNRPGKITDQRSTTRFDAIKTNADALHIAVAANVSDAAGAHLLVASARMLFWCCENVLNADRVNFAARASAVLRSCPTAWQKVATEQLKLDMREQLLVAALLHGDERVIASLAARQIPPLRAGLRLAAGRHGLPFRRLAQAGVHRTLRGVAERAKRLAVGRAR